MKCTVCGYNNQADSTKCAICNATFLAVDAGSATAPASVIIGTPPSPPAPSISAVEAVIKAAEEQVSSQGE